MDRGFAARLYPAAAKEPSPTLIAIVQYPLENNARQRDGFTEKGASAALGSSGGSQQTAFTTLGVHAATSFETFGLPASVRGSLGWHHATGDTDATSTLRFSSGLPFADRGCLHRYQCRSGGHRS